MDRKALLAMTADIVAAHASSTSMSQDQLLVEIQNVFAKLAALQGDGDVQVDQLAIPGLEPEPMKPAVPLEAAFGSDKVFCMVCGKGMKTLKRHISTSHAMKPGQYRKQFGIPSGTPLVAKDYSDRRKEMANKNKLADVLAKARAVRGKKNAEKAPKKSAAKVPGRKPGRPKKA